MAKRANKPLQVAESHRLTISVYQNGDHVSGLLQQAYDQGLLRADSEETGQQDSQSQGRDSGFNVGADASGNVPALAKFGAKFGYTRNRRDGDESRQETRVSSTYEYTEAYYLHAIRRFLEEGGLLKPVLSVADAEALSVGEFVEFRASFRPNQMTPFLDILTPELVGELVRSRSLAAAADKIGALEGFSGLSGFDSVRAYAEQSNIKANAASATAAAITAAVRADFRGEATREYYGLVGSGSYSVTAVTVCDTACFLVDDADRLLDGCFTVLGKVTTTVAVDVPALARNKLLNRLEPEFVDKALNGFRELTKASAAKVEGGETAVEEILDATLESRIVGSSFNVIPIAIYL